MVFNEGQNKQRTTYIDQEFHYKNKKEWKSLSIEFAIKFADSMKNRVELWVEREGDYINYWDDVYKF